MADLPTPARHKLSVELFVIGELKKIFHVLGKYSCLKNLYTPKCYVRVHCWAIISALLASFGLTFFFGCRDNAIYPLASAILHVPLPTSIYLYLLYLIYRYVLRMYYVLVIRVQALLLRCWYLVPSYWLWFNRHRFRIINDLSNTSTKTSDFFFEIDFIEIIIYILLTRGKNCSYVLKKKKKIVINNFKLSAEFIP